MKNLIVVAQNPTLAQQNAIMNVIQANYAYWHWVSNIWLVTDSLDRENAGSLRDKVRDAAPDCHIIVFDVKPQTWAGYSDKRWAEWLEQYWTTRW